MGTRQGRNEFRSFDEEREMSARRLSYAQKVRPRPESSVVAAQGNGSQPGERGEMPNILEGGRRGRGEGGAG